MKTRVMTTNPAGHTVSLFGTQLSAYEVADIYQEFYRDVEVFHEESTTPPCWYIRCYPKDTTKPTELYQVKNVREDK